MPRRVPLLVLVGACGGSPSTRSTEEATWSASDSGSDGGSTATASTGESEGGEIPCIDSAAPGRLAVCPPRGFFVAPIEIEVVADDPSAIVRITWDGSEPGPDAEPYARPLVVAGADDRGAATLRAAAFVGDVRTTAIATHTYVFADDVFDQAGDPAGFPPTWGGGPGPEIDADYAMDPRVLDDASSRAAGLAGLRALPVISVVTAPAHLFDPETGIYVHPSQEGPQWERPASLELLHADGTPGFQIDCALRAQGGSSTEDWKSPKVSLRARFDADYGPPRLSFPLFPDAEIESFETLVLDAHLNLTWIHPDEDQRVMGQYVRDLFVADLQNEVGSLAPHGRFVDLFLDGLYWGVYELHERPDDAFAAAYLGGAASEYDVIRNGEHVAVAGDLAAWDTMMVLGGADLSDAADYAALAEYLDVADLADYMLVNLWAGNTDWPAHNWYATRRRVDGAGFRFHSWDAEHVLEATDDDVTTVDDAGTPAELFHRLLDNADFRALVEARIAATMLDGGPLTVDAASERYLERLAEIEDAIVLESARWGDYRRPDRPYTRDDEFATERARLVETYFPVRTDIVLEQLAGLGLGP